MLKRSLAGVGAGLAVLVLIQPAQAVEFKEALGQKFKAGRRPAGPPLGRPAADTLRQWNRIAIDTSGLDHTPVADDEVRTFGEQIGPGRSSRAMAIVHLAMFDALNAVTQRYRSYSGVPAGAMPCSTDAAVAQAAYDTLATLYPSHSGRLNGLLNSTLARVKDKRAKQNGVDLGHRVASAILALRQNDGSANPELRVGIDYFTKNEAGHWRQDPISLIPLALGAHWGECAPFVLATPSQFRVPPPPPMGSPAYAAAFNEVKALGGDGVITPTSRTDEQTFIGIFWAYDGTPSLCAPPRLYNQIAMQIGDQTHLDPLRLARLLALVNVAMADAGIASWESKYFWDVWRPVTGIREADPGTGPSGTGDGNNETIGDPTFTPLGAPASNLNGPNFTPPFPAYPSGHATFGGALFQVLRRFYGTDRLGFTFVSDEYNGITKGNDGSTRPHLPRSFSTLSQAEEENGQSRIYLGIHWSFDKTEGIVQGRRVGNYVYDRILQPRP